MTARRKFDTALEQNIYDGFIDHPYEISDEVRFQPRSGEGRSFSPYAHVVDKVFRDAFLGGPISEADLAMIAHPNPQYKLPAYYAGLDLCLGEQERGSTDLISRWLAGGNCALPGHMVSRHGIMRVGTRPSHVAAIFDGVIYYEWGSLPGHRFPASAIPMTGGEWKRRAEALSFIRKFEKGSFAHRKQHFYRFEHIVRMELPTDSRLGQTYARYGVIGLLRRYFGQRWSAAITTPDMKLAKGISYCYVKGEGNCQYMLCDMDDAVHHLLLNSGECAIHDLTTPIDLGDTV